MDLNVTRTIARSLMRKHGLNNWTLEFVESVSFAGQCHYQKKVIQLNTRWMKVVTAKDVENTILHEIAHALTPGHHHDSVWRATFIAIGGNGKRTTDAGDLFKTKKYTVHCSDGCMLGYRERRDPRLVNNKVCRKHRSPLHYRENANA